MFWIIAFIILAILVLTINSVVLKKNPNPITPTAVANLTKEAVKLRLPRTSVTIVFSQTKKFKGSWPFGSLTLYETGFVAKAFQQVSISYKDIDHIKRQGLIVTLWFKTESPVQILVQSSRAALIEQILNFKGVSST